MQWYAVLHIQEKKRYTQGILKHWKVKTKQFSCLQNSKSGISGFCTMNSKQKQANQICYWTFNFPLQHFQKVIRWDLI
jgi:hypothetical protein